MIAKGSIGSIIPGQIMPIVYAAEEDIPIDEPDYIGEVLRVDNFSTYQGTDSFTISAVQPAITILANTSSNPKDYCDCHLMGESITFRVDQKYYPKSRVRRWLQKVLLGMTWKIYE